jgi:hypothetical protein
MLRVQSNSWFLKYVLIPAILITLVVGVVLVISLGA